MATSSPAADIYYKSVVFRIQSRKSKATAFGGIFAGLSLLVLFLSGVIPFAEYTCPALAGIFLIPLVIEFDKKTAWICYGAVSVLGFFITPNRESAVLFIVLLGYYPILKSHLEQLPSRLFEWILKLLTFNLSGAAAFFLLFFVFGMTGLLKGSSGVWMIFWALLANVTFIVYDYALSGVIFFYSTRLRPHLPF